MKLYKRALPALLLCTLLTACGTTMVDSTPIASDSEPQSSAVSVPEQEPDQPVARTPIMPVLKASEDYQLYDFNWETGGQDWRESEDGRYFRLYGGGDLTPAEQALSTYFAAELAGDFTTWSALEKEPLNDDAIATQKEFYAEGRGYQRLDINILHELTLDELRLVVPVTDIGTSWEKPLMSAYFELSGYVDYDEYLTALYEEGNRVVYIRYSCVYTELSEASGMQISDGGRSAYYLLSIDEAGNYRLVSNTFWTGGTFYVMDNQMSGLVSGGQPITD